MTRNATWMALQVSLAVFVASPRFAPAATPQQLCEAAKLKAASNFAQCRAEADSAFAKSARTQTDSDKREAAYARCDKVPLKACGTAQGEYGSDPDLVATNVVSGVNPFGVSATAAPGNGLLKTGQTTSYGPGSDGAVQAGTAQSFTDNGNGTVTDNRTGLMWEKKSDDGGIHDKDTTYTWGQEVSPYSMNGTMVTTFLAALNTAPCFAGYCDWRIPNGTELLSLANWQASDNSTPKTFPAFNTNCTAGCTVTACGCTNVGFYWSSSTINFFPQLAGIAYTGNGEISRSGRKTSSFYVRAVRGGVGTTGTTISNGLLKTGQTTSYGPGSDGAVQAGTAQSFTDNGNGTVSDNRTGLMWEKKSDDGGIHDKDTTYTWGQDVSPYSMNGTMVTTFLAALNTAPCFAGYCDWRIPNGKELFSLLNWQTSQPATFPAFNASCTVGCTVTACNCTVSAIYWSSSTAPLRPGSALLLNFYYGEQYAQAKPTGGHVRAVRGGLICGNSVVDPGEDCDDGNTSGGDCCSATCTYEAAGSTCLDGNLCNGSESCDGRGTCNAGPALNCDDGNACTADTCDATAGCRHAPKAIGTPCRGATGACDVAETCDGGGNCPADGFAAAGTPCGDGNLCNGSEACDGGGTCGAGTALNCDDGNLCTQDSCNPALGCTHAPVDCSSLDKDCLVHTCQPASGQCVAASSPGCLDVVALEPVQVLQNWGNSISPLVAGKSTFVRVHLQTRDGSLKWLNRPVKLEGWRAGLKLGTLDSINDRVKVGADASAVTARADVFGSALFQLPASWTKWKPFALQLKVLGSTGTQRLACRDTVGTPRDCATSVYFRNVPAPAAIIGRISYVDRNGKKKVTPESDADEIVSQLTAAWPVSEGAVAKAWKREVWDLRLDGRKLNGEEFIESALSQIQDRHVKYDYSYRKKCTLWIFCRKIREQTQKRFWIGVLPQSYALDTRNQQSGIAGYALWSNSEQQYASVSTPQVATVLQEVGHNVGWDHARDPAKSNCGNKCGSCGEVTDSRAAAYPDWANAEDSRGKIRRLPVLTAASSDPVWGFAVDRFRKSMNSAVAPPRQAFSFMSYCWGPRGKWMDLSHYLELGNRFRSMAAAVGTPMADVAAALSVQVSGNIDALANRAEVSRVEWQESDETTEVTSGPFRLEALDVDGAVVGTAAFDRTPLTHEHTDSADGEDLPWAFTVAIPDPESRAVAFRIVHDGQVIGEFAASPSPPTVQLLEPTGGGELNGKVTVSWKVEDADGDVRATTLFYSRDGGISWQVLATDLAGSSHEVDLDQLGGGSESLFKVAVTDGYWLNDDVTDVPFSVRTKGPRVEVLGAADRPYSPDELVDLSAEVDDLEGDDIGEDQVEWRSDRDGELGSGKGLERLASTLSVGDHLITAKAVDGSGDAGEGSVRLRIESQLPACRDGRDNDGDGLVDFGVDGECTTQDDSSETPDCADGIDNDRDGRVDYPADSSCKDPLSPGEVTECSDGIDNDSDGAIDGDDTKCPSPSSPTEGQPNVCGDGLIGDAEQCDDGNRADEDGCSENCGVESGWRCDGAPSECSTVGLQDPKQRACIKALHKTLAGVASAQGRTNTACLQGRRLNPALDAAACVVGDGYGLVGNATTKFANARARACSGARPDFGASKSDSTASRAARQRRGLLADVIGGRPDSAIAGALTPNAATCQSKAVAAVERYADARVKEVLRCVSKRLASAEDGIVLAGCLISTAAADPKIRAAFDKLSSSVTSACTTEDIPVALPGLCSSETTGSLSACLDRKASCRLCVMARSSFGLPVDCEIHDDGLRNDSCDPSLILDEATGDGIVLNPLD